MAEYCLGFLRGQNRQGQPAPRLGGDTLLSFHPGCRTGSVWKAVYFLVDSSLPVACESPAWEHVGCVLAALSFFR